MEEEKRLKKKYVISVRITEKEMLRVLAASNRKGLTFSDAVRQALRRWLANGEKEYGRGFNTENNDDVVG